MTNNICFPIHSKIQAPKMSSSQKEMLLPSLCLTSFIEKIRQKSNKNYEIKLLLDMLQKGYWKEDWQNSRGCGQLSLWDAPPLTPNCTGTPVLRDTCYSENSVLIPIWVQDCYLNCTYMSLQLLKVLNTISFLWQIGIAVNSHRSISPHGAALKKSKCRSKPLK